MSGKKLMDMFERYHVAEITGICVSLVMTVVSYIPIFRKYVPYQLAIVIFFLVTFLTRLTLFFWDRKTADTEKSGTERAKMMLVSAVILFLSYSPTMTSVVYQLLINKELPFMASTLPLAIAYGVFAFAKIGFSVYGTRRQRPDNMYTDTLSYIGWISTLYTLSLFTDYILLSRGSLTVTWPKYLMIMIMSVGTAVIITVMLIRSIKTLLKAKKEKKA